MIKMGQLSVQIFQYRYPNRPGLSKTDELVEIGANPKSRSFTSPANVTDLSPGRPRQRLHLGVGEDESYGIHIDAPEHWRGSADHMRRWHNLGCLPPARGAARERMSLRTAPEARLCNQG